MAYTELLCVFVKHVGRQSVLHLLLTLLSGVCRPLDVDPRWGTVSLLLGLSWLVAVVSQHNERILCSECFIDVSNEITIQCVCSLKEHHCPWGTYHGQVPPHIPSLAVSPECDSVSRSQETFLCSSSRHCRVICFLSGFMIMENNCWLRGGSVIHAC